MVSCLSPLHREHGFVRADVGELHRAYEQGWRGGAGWRSFATPHATPYFMGFEEFDAFGTEMGVSRARQLTGESRCNSRQEQ
ncbi:hypothetical protein A9Q96_16900 [Rhodobacterales bacterium 52_120_T64]|nr:hypothetical protein A9Q96_16900 [Rhodobacterales bacterium 52_120_T64]